MNGKSILTYRPVPFLMSLADVRRPQVDPKLAQIRQLQDELWKLEGPSAEEIQAAKAAAQKVPGGDRRWRGRGCEKVGQCEGNWMVPGLCMFM